MNDVWQQFAGAAGDPRVQACARRQASRYGLDHRDLMQEAVLRASLARADRDRVDDPVAYLCATIPNVANSLWRRNRRPTEPIEPGEEPDYPDPDALRDPHYLEVEWALRIDAVAACLDDDGDRLWAAAVADLGVGSHPEQVREAARFAALQVFTPIDADARQWTARELLEGSLSRQPWFADRTVGPQARAKRVLRARAWVSHVVWAVVVASGSGAADDPLLEEFTRFHHDQVHLLRDDVERAARTLKSARARDGVVARREALSSHLAQLHALLGIDGVCDRDPVASDRL